MAKVFIPGKMLISFLPRGRGDYYVEVTKRAGARGGTVSYGKALADSKILQLLALADVYQDIVFTLMGGEAGAVISAVREAARSAPKKLGGLALVLPVCGMQVSEQAAAAMKNETEAQSGSIKMESGHKLITAIVNSGYANDVMAAARKAGATGGTIMVARGTGTEDDVKFFGITLVPEKEILMIVAQNEKTDDIMNSINSAPVLRQPGSGIAYCSDVEQFIVLGRQEPDDAEG